MDFVQICHCAVAPGELADGADRRDIAVHRIDALERNQFGPVAGSNQQFFEVSEIVVAEDDLVAARLAHALDHRIVVQRIGDDQASGNQLGNGRDAGLVRDVAGGEDEGRVLGMEVGELRFEVDDSVAVAGDVAGTARTGAERARRFPPWRGSRPGSDPCQDNRWSTRR